MGSFITDFTEKSSGRCGHVYEAFMGLVEKESDCSDDRIRKRLLFPMGAVFLALYMFLVPYTWATESWYAAMFMSGVRMLLFVLFYIYCITTKTCPTWLVEGIIVAVGFTIFLVDDILTYGIYESWSAAILMMDGLLLTKCRDRVTTLAFFGAALYLTVKTTEEAFDIGIYGNLPSVADNLSPRDSQGSYWFFRVLPLRLITFMADFVMTRNFANGMRSEKQRSEEDIIMANRVAASLVKFDLDAAEHHLVKRHSGSSSDLRDAFLSLIANLKLYKPYLPDALFHLSESSSEIEHADDHPVTKYFPARQTPPGMGGESVALAFTDIQSSTDIWEKHTTAMRTAMELHNQAMRECIFKTNGYEVKTIGDAFMVAFDTVAEAVRFSLMAQEELLAQPWPSSLLEHHLCKASSGAWKGLRVRIGVHTGHARLEVNPTTARTDYMGPTVNKTARVEAASVGGAVAVTDEVLQALDKDGGLKEMGSPLTIKIGTQKLKGVGCVPIVLLIPAKLQQRAAEVEMAVEEKQRLTQTAEESDQSVLSQTTLTLKRHDMPTRGINRNKLAQAVGTIGTTRLELSDLQKFGNVVNAVGEVLGTVLDGVNRTDGVVTALCSSTVLVGWNTSKQCLMHVAQSAKFALYVHRAVKNSGWAGQVTVGLCGGRVLHGMMGSTKQRFMTTIGGCVEVSRALANAAKTFETLCLLTGTGTGSAMACRRGSSTVHDNSLQAHVRPIDTWDGVTIYQLNLETFALVQGVWNIFDGPVPTSWSTLYKDAFDSGDVASLKEQSLEDPSLLKVIAILQGNLSLPRPFTSQKIDKFLTTPDGYEDIGPESPTRSAVNAFVD